MKLGLLIFLCIITFFLTFGISSSNVRAWIKNHFFSTLSVLKDYWPVFFLANGLYFLFLGYFYYPQGPVTLAVLAPIAPEPPKVVKPPSPPPPPPKPKSWVKQVDENVWNVTLWKSDGWFDTGIPVIIGSTLRMSKKDGGTWPRFLLKLEDRVLFPNYSGEGFWIFFGESSLECSECIVVHKDFFETVKLKVDEDSPGEGLTVVVGVRINKGVDQNLVRKYESEKRKIARQ